MMTKISAISFMLFICLSTGKISAQEPAEKFEQGVKLFTNGNYEEALTKWTDLYNTGYRSAELDYNIGNAYFKVSNIPGAILFYERAWLLKPGDENINYNLQIARSMIVDRFKEIPELFFVKWYNFASLVFSSNTWAIVSLITFLFCLVFLSLYIYSSRYNLKVAGFWLAVSMFVISVSGLSFSLRNKGLVYDSHKAIIFSPLVNGKSSPDESGTDLFVIHEGSAVTIEDKVGEWCEVRLSDGNKGWLPSNCLSNI